MSGQRGHVAKKVTGSGKVRWYPVTEQHDADGKRKRQWHEGHATKREAQRALTDLLGRLESGTYVPPSRQTLGQFLEREWLPALRVAVKRPTTFESYRLNVEKRIVPRIGQVELRQLGPAHLNAFYADLLASGRANGSGGLSKRSVQMAHVTVHRALRDAVRWGKVARNVADLADPPTPSKREMVVWTGSEVAAFLEHVRNDRLAALWRVLVMAGLRRGEAAGLRWSDLDLNARTLAVRRSLVAVSYSRVVESEPKTARGRRVVALDAATIAALRAHRARQLEERLAWGAAWQDSGLVFTREDGAALHPDAISATFRQRVRTSGLPRITVHGLRHTSVSLALAAGVHPKVASERAGHASVAFTLDRYSHVVQGLQEDAAARMAALVAGG